MRYPVIISALFMCVMLPQSVFAQIINGRIIDSVTKQPIVGATICCYPDSAYCTTDTLGKFMLDGIKHSRIDLEVISIGYDKALLSQILTSSSKDLTVVIELKEQLYELDEITVSARHPKMLPRNDMAITSSRTFSVEECRRYAGGLDDPARMVSNFAGCVTATPESNAIIVRGNSPLGVLWRLEGIDIPTPVHFNGSGDLPGGGLYTIFSSFMLANSDFYSGCFPAEFFNVVSGIFDMKFRSGNPLKYEFASQVGIQGLEFSAEGPLSRAKSSTFLCNARVSTMQLLNSIVPELSKRQSVNYHDCAAKLDFPLTKIGHISAWGIWGGSKLTRIAPDDITQWLSPSESSDVSMRNEMFAIGITNESSFGNHASIINTIAVTDENRYMSYGVRKPKQPEMPVSDYIYDTKCYNLITSSVVNHKISNRLIGRYGLIYKQIWDDYEYQIGDNLDIQMCDYNGRSSLFNGHTQFKYNLSSYMTAIFGGSLTYFSLTNDYSIEPRLGINYKPKDNHSIAMGVGIHSQIAPLYIYMMNIANKEVIYTTPNLKLKMMKALHLNCSYNWAISPVCRLKIEPYFQYLYDVPVVENETFSVINLTTQPSIMQNRFVNNGAGINIGVDITFERFLNKGYYYMGTLSIFKSSYKDYFNNWHPTMFDARWYVNILGGKEFSFKRNNGLSKVLGLNAHISMSGYTPYTPVDYELSHFSQTLIYDNVAPYSYRKKGINILSDISFTYMVNYRLFSGTIALQIKNLFGKQYIGKFYNLTTNSIDDLYFSNPIPLLSYKIEF